MLSSLSIFVSLVASQPPTQDEEPQSTRTQRQPKERCNQKSTGSVFYHISYVVTFVAIGVKFRSTHSATSRLGQSTRHGHTPFRMSSRFNIFAPFPPALSYLHELLFDIGLLLILRSPRVWFDISLSTRCFTSNIIITLSYRSGTVLLNKR